MLHVDRTEKICITGTRKDYFELLKTLVSLVTSPEQITNKVQVYDYDSGCKSEMSLIMISEGILDNGK